jgi:AcrR family transcriptional regulator
MVRGRPREFDPDETLDQVLVLFWRDGFDGASMQDLADSVGVSKPSLYAAYGNKEALFLAALERYASTHGGRQAAELDAEPDVRVAVQRMLEHVVDAPAPGNCGQPAGCMVVMSSALCDAPHVPVAVQESVRGMLQLSADALACRLQRAAADGALPAGTDPRALAEYFSAVMCGLSVQARSGVDRAVLRQVVATAMQAWP